MAIYETKPNGYTLLCQKSDQIAKKMKPLSIFCFIILLALESNMFKSCFAARPLSPWEVAILNNMKDSTLIVHCKSKDDNLGEHVVNVGGKYYWMFKENLWQTTLFWCNFSSKYGKTSGEVFWPEKRSWLSNRCDHNTCIWAAQESGIYLRLGSFDYFQLIYPWK